MIKITPQARAYKIEGLEKDLVASKKRVETFLKETATFGRQVIFPGTFRDVHAKGDLYNGVGYTVIVGQTGIMGGPLNYYEFTGTSDFVDLAVWKISKNCEVKLQEIEQ